MGIRIENGLIKEIWSDESSYNDQLTYLLVKLAAQFPGFKFKVSMSGWYENGKIASLNYYIFAADHPIWFAEYAESIEQVYYKIVKKLNEHEQIEVVDDEEEKYEGGLF